MYYIINQTSQVVAIDPEFLSFLNIEDADTFYKKTALGDIFIDQVENRVNITVDGKIHSFDAASHPLSGILGDIILINLTVPETSAAEEEEISLDLDEASSLKLLSEEDSINKEIQNPEEIISLDDIDLFEEPKSETVQESNADKKEVMLPKEEDDLFELILPTDAENAIAEISSDASHKEESVHKEETPAEDHSPIYIDIGTISEKIGISTDDYNLFLNEYIDTAITFEEALQSNNKQTKEEALNTLSHLSNVLHLPYVGDLLEQIKTAAPEEEEHAIGAFFSALGRLTTAQFDEEKVSVETPETTEETIEVPEILKEEPPVKGQRAPIDLSDVKPIHFDFQLEEAARDLSLPVELIEEFVNDFIEQAHEETEKMLQAYEKGDLETIQKIGHLLKGTSSNLRITPLSDTLYEIQFNEDLNRVPELVRNYWGHFLSLENQIKLISK